MRRLVLAAALLSFAPIAPADADRAAGPVSAAITVIDSTGSIAARWLSDTTVLVNLSPDMVAPALIRPMLSADSRTASGQATWQAGGSVLFTSGDCSTGAYIYSHSGPGLRAATQVETPRGIVLYAGAIATPVTVTINSILYDNGCSAVSVQQNGLVAVDATLNLSTTYPPPLSVR